MRSFPLIIFLNFLFVNGVHSEITVAAAISMSDAVEEISDDYEAATGVEVRLTFSGTNVLARQIEAGAPVDVFISADAATMDALRKKKLVEESGMIAVATNRLVVVVPGNRKIAFNSADDLLGMDRIAVADPASVPAGIYARTWLEAEGLWEKVAPKTIPLQNVRAALLAVETGNADAAIVYLTDAFSSEKVRKVFDVPGAKSGRIEYPAAVVVGSGKKGEAIRFLRYLTSDKSGAVFEKHGFGKP